MTENFYDNTFLIRKLEFQQICDHIVYNKEADLADTDKTVYGKKIENEKRSFESLKDDILLYLGIVIWILVISLVDIVDGTAWGAILFPAFFLFAIWYTPIAIYKKFISYHVKNK